MQYHISKFTASGPLDKMQVGFLPSEVSDESVTLVTMGQVQHLIQKYHPVELLVEAQLIPIEVTRLFLGYLVGYRKAGLRVIVLNPTDHMKEVLDLTRLGTIFTHDTAPPLSG